VDVSWIDRMTARFQPRPSEIAAQDYVSEAVTIIIEAAASRKQISIEKPPTTLIRSTENSLRRWLNLMKNSVRNYSVNQRCRVSKCICSFTKILSRSFISRFSCEFGTIMNHLNVRLRFEKNPLLDRLSGNWKINCIPINGFARTGDSLRESLRTKLLEIGPE